MSRKLRVAVLGTGRMGSAIAGRLHDAGFDLILWNRTASKAHALGFGTIAETAAAAVRWAQVVVSSLADGLAVRDVYIGEHGALAAAAGQTFVETGTIGSPSILELAAELADKGSVLIEAPILGAAPTLAAGNALVLVGGERRRIAEVLPVLKAIGTVQEVGRLGRASQLKLLSNCLVAAQNVVGAELLHAADTLDLDRETLFDLLQRQAPGLAVRRTQYVSGNPQPVIFTLAGMLKDLALAREEFAHAKMPVTAAVYQIVETAAKGGEGRDLAAVVTSYAEEPSERNGIRG